MHGGEAETSILLAAAPELVRDGDRDADHLADDRRLLPTTGMAGYTENGIVGLPSKATAEKGHALLAAVSRIFKVHLSQLQ
jgi:creatinine amidohydrolase